MAFRVSILVALLCSVIPATRMQAQQTVCYFGDSITEGWIDAERRPSEAYPMLVDSVLRAEGTVVRGIVSARGGESTEDALARFEREAQAHRPDVLVFAYGSNDYFVWGDIPAPRVSLERFRFHCRVMIEAVVRSGCRVIVLPPPPVIAHRFHRFVDSADYVPYGGVAQLRDRYAAALRTVVAEFPCARLLAVDSLLLGDPDAMGFDGVHPSAIGHRRLAASVAGALQAALDETCDGRESLDGIQMYPLPFNRLSSSVSSIGFPASDAGRHFLRINDLAGRTLRTFEHHAMAAGNATVLWDGTDDAGTPVGAGAYILTVSAPTRVYPPFSIIVQ